MQRKKCQFLLKNSSNETKICFQKLLKVQDHALYLKYIFMLIKYFMAKLKPNENKTENDYIKL